jgi:hypothetical protein
MYRSLLLAAVLIAGLTGSSFTSARKKQATIVRDCSGTYIRSGKTDYLVCNKEILQDIPDGSAVSVSFKKTTACPPTDEMVCLLYHEHAGVITISKVQWSKGTIRSKH